MLGFGVLGLATSAVAQESILALVVDPAKETWSADWGGGTRIAEAGFSLEVDSMPMVSSPGEHSETEFVDGQNKGRLYRTTWRSGGVRIERELRIWTGRRVLEIGGSIVNESGRSVRLGTAKLIDSRHWSLGDSRLPPAAVYGSKPSQTAVTPLLPAGSTPAERSYIGSGVLALYNAPRAALTLAWVRSDQASPDLEARFVPGEGGVSLVAASRYLDRLLEPGAGLEFGRVRVSAGPDPFAELEAVGEAMARMSARPARSGPVALWCSWYAHRMQVSEEKVLANAAVAARHFGPLGFDYMQVDHGWQQGDITGDWVPNGRFPHGLKWLADQLRERYGLKLGLWISPTDVAETSQLFQQHPDWMLSGEDGKPSINWKWYWAPNPNCYQLDSSRPEVREHIANVFRRLSSEGVAYFKIDFIGSQAKEKFVPWDRAVTRGWPVLRLAMEAVRSGAGEKAWVRFCQGPPLLSVGLADGAYGGDDTGDAGQPGLFRLLSDNARILATSYWIQGRGYQREVCDMSVRMQATIEEARVRAAIMTLAGASISWSDELTYLPPSRIRMMQQCLPAGSPGMRPLDLFEREIPSVWHLRPKNEADQWDVVGLFNFGEREAATRTVRFEDLGLDPEADYAAFEFWEERFLGTFRGRLAVTLPPASSRIVSLRRVRDRPQLIGTDMHVLQGYHELKSLQWDEATTTLSGRFHRMAGVQSRAFFLVPAGYTPKFEFPLSPASARLTHVADRLWSQEITFDQADHEWRIPFERVPLATAKEPN